MTVPSCSCCDRCCARFIHLCVTVSREDRTIVSPSLCPFNSSSSACLNANSAEFSMKKKKHKKHQVYARPRSRKRGFVCVLDCHFVLQSYAAVWSAECCEIYNYCGVLCYDSAGASGDSTSQPRPWETHCVCARARCVCANTGKTLSPKHFQPLPLLKHSLSVPGGKRLGV